MSNNKEKDLSIIMTLLHNGVKFIGITYSGGGDSGAIDEIFLFKKLDEESIQTGKLPEDFIYNREQSDEVELLELEINNDAVENLFFPHLDRIEDWWNNEGGYGSAVLDLERMMLEIDNNTYYTETHVHKHSIEL